MSSITGTVTLNIEVRINGFLIEGQKAAELAYKLLGPAPEGADTGDEVSTPENGSEPQYRYFHDGDIEGYRWYRKIEHGMYECSGLRFREEVPEEGWKESRYRYTPQELAAWVEVEYSELPADAR